MDRLTVSLRNPVQAYAEIKRVWEWAKAMLVAGHKLILEIKSATRSTEQNAMLHGMISRISAQKEWAGKKRDIDTWKRLLVAAWTRAIGEPVEILPALDGNGVDIVFRKTSKLSVSECSELIEFVLAWATENGVLLDERVDQETGEILSG